MACERTWEEKQQVKYFILGVGLEWRGEEARPSCSLTPAPSFTEIRQFKIYNVLPWLVWLSGLGTEGLQVQFQAGACAWVFSGG